MNDKFEIDSDERLFGGNNNFNEEEALDGGDDYYEDDVEDEEEETEDEETDGEGKDDETRVHLSFACDDCDYRWDDVIVGNKEKIEREEFDMACPMCGSMAITQI
jgi:hypothetical protein